MEGRTKTEGHGTSGKYSARKTAAFGLIAFALAILLGSEPLRAWASLIKTESLRTVALVVADPLYRFCGAIGLDRPYDFLRGGFLALIGQAADAPNAPSGAAATAGASKAREAPAPPHAERHGPGNPLSVLLVGDSLAWNHLPTQFAESIKGREDIAFTHTYRISSTLSDPSIYDWIAGISEILKKKEDADGKPYDLAIVTIGGNDAQGIHAASGSLAFKSEPWMTEFRSRMRAFMDILNEHARRVYWLSIPPMRKDGYKDRMVFMNELYREGAAAYPSFTYIDLDRIIGDADGHFVPVKTIAGRQESIRSKDGIHYDFPGAQLVVDRIMESLKADFGL
jgi:hypothetical protein